ncbi:MAG: hypothetical protein LBN43_10080 [Oscillospiraceae bacterium]|jgi:hypothetical protein|nr:hypothetical protein [Oscillospiraceae bacterium]
MKKFIPYEKLSKKERRLLNAGRRGSWGALNPVTRVPPDPKIYNRAKQKRRTGDNERFSAFSRYLRLAIWG